MSCMIHIVFSPLDSHTHALSVHYFPQAHRSALKPSHGVGKHPKPKGMHDLLSRVVV